MWRHRDITNGHMYHRHDDELKVDIRFIISNSLSFFSSVMSLWLLICDLSPGRVYNEITLYRSFDCRLETAKKSRWQLLCGEWSDMTMKPFDELPQNNAHDDVAD